MSCDTWMNWTQMGPGRQEKRWKKEFSHIGEEDMESNPKSTKNKIMKILIHVKCLCELMRQVQMSKCSQAYIYKHP